MFALDLADRTRDATRGRPDPSPDRRGTTSGHGAPRTARYLPVSAPIFSRFAETLRSTNQNLLGVEMFEKLTEAVAEKTASSALAGVDAPVSILDGDLPALILMSVAIGVIAWKWWGRSRDDQMELV